MNSAKSAPTLDFFASCIAALNVIRQLLVGLKVPSNSQPSDTVSATLPTLGGRVALQLPPLAAWVKFHVSASSGSTGRSHSSRVRCLNHSLRKVVSAGVSAGFRLLAWAGLVRLERSGR
jgi:hypothetical protein